MPLYAWQDQCVKCWLAHGCRGIAKCVTGAGKTLMALSAATSLEARSPSLMVKIIVPKMFMVFQWKRAIEDHASELGSFAGDIGVYYGRKKDRQDHRCMIYVINSAREAISREVLAELEGGRDVLYICDECHHVGSPENRKIFFFSEARKKKRYLFPTTDEAPLRSGEFFALGLSATPENAYFDEFITKAIGPVFFTYDFAQAIGDGIVSDCVLYDISLTLDEETRLLYADLSRKISRKLGQLKAMFPPLEKAEPDLFISIIQRLAGQARDEEIAACARSFLSLSQERSRLLVLNPRRLDAVEALMERLDPRRKVLIYTERIEQCEELYTRFCEKGANLISRYHSKMAPEAKARNLKEFREGRSRLLLCCRSLDEGLDIPAIDVGIVLSCSSQERQRVQRLGRILRRNRGKSLSALYYFYFRNTSDRHSVIDKSPGDHLREEAIVYREEYRDFSFPVYEELARLLFSVISSESGAKAVDVLRPYIEEGKMRPDWLVAPHILSSLVEDGDVTAHDHNYAVAMLLLSRLNEKTKGE